MKSRFIAQIGLGLAVAASVSTTQAGSIVIPSYAFDRGNAKTFTREWADAGPMVAFGGQSPVVVEYDIEFPVAAEYTLHIQYAAATARPAEFSLDGKSVGPVCRSATGGWNTSNAQWEESCHIQLSRGKHTLTLQRDGDFPHIVSLRFESTTPFPSGWELHRPKARKLTDPPPSVIDQPSAVNLAALRLAIEDLIKTFGDKYPRGPEFLRRLDGTRDDADLRALQREALLANPLLDFDRLLLVRRGVNQLGLPLNWEGNSSLPTHGYDNEIMVLSDLRGSGRLETLYKPATDIYVGDLSLHFDGERLLFSSIGTQNRFQVFEMKLAERHPQQLTPGEHADVDNYDAIYLPGDDVLFSSTAAYLGVPCVFGSSHIANLYRLNRASGSIRQVTFEQEHDWSPSVLHNGRVLYARWEYTDQSHANSRFLFHMNPDGTDQREYRGSGSWFPGSMFYAKPIPGETHQVVGVAVGHHDVPRAGRLLILDPTRGRRDGEGIVQEIPHRGRKVEPIVRDGLVGGTFPQFLMPAPLSAKYHLVACKPQPNSSWGIYLVDVFDNMTLIKEVEGSALLWPIPIQKSATPPVIRERVDPKRGDCTVFIDDIYSGPGLQEVPRGTVAKLRVIEYYFSRRGMGGLYGTLGLDGPWDVKRILGTVPVERDGSALFTLPANTAVCVQPLDDKGQALQLERSWFVGMPGERLSCIGCHESQDQGAISKAALAVRRAPSPIEPWHGPARGFSFVREVQPVLDRYCVSCHDESHPDRPYLKGDKRLTDWSTQMSGHWAGGGKFTQSYFELQRFMRRPGIEGDRRMFTPMDYHFSTTELGQMLRKGHHGVTVDAESWERLASWLDFNAPFYGTWGEVPGLSCDNVNKVNARALELRKQYVLGGPFSDFEAIPEVPKYDVAPVVPVANRRADIANPKCDGWPFDAAEAQRRQLVAGELITRTIDLGDGATLELTRIPGGRFVMGSADGHHDEAPPTVAELKPFWMARFETTNRQFKQFDAGHESRTEDRHGYQFGITGYDQDQPDQPVVRVSWHKAKAFCRWLSAKTGESFTLPNEAQWEWACRAGAATPFWYGDLNTDFAPFANLGDAMLANFAGNPYVQDWKGAAFKNPNKYDNWIPQDARFNDGGFVTEPVGKYKPNPWGLQDMHGNAAEWTLSSYRPYPYRDDDGRNDLNLNEEKVVRGGSWYDRPKHSTSSFRLPYRPYQQVYNVGFRVICEMKAVNEPQITKLSQTTKEKP